jgi:hypothetical protein
MEALPPQVTYQSSLEELNLWDTNLKELSIAIGNLCDLEILKLHCSSLEMLSPSLGNLSSLRDLIEYLLVAYCLIQLPLFTESIQNTNNAVQAIIGFMFI